MILATLERWQTVCSASGFEGTPRDYARVMRGWSSWGRHYHTLGHLEEYFKEFDQARHLAQRAGEVELALWFHDAVYRTWASDNEARSAALAADYKKDECVEKLRLPQTGVAIPERCRKEYRTCVHFTDRKYGARTLGVVHSGRCEMARNCAGLGEGSAPGDCAADRRGLEAKGLSLAE